MEVIHTERENAPGIDIADQLQKEGTELLSEPEPEHTIMAGGPVQRVYEDDVPYHHVAVMSTTAVVSQSSSRPVNSEQPAAVTSTAGVVSQSTSRSVNSWQPTKLNFEHSSI